MKMHPPALARLLVAAGTFSGAAALSKIERIAVALPAPELQSNKAADRFAAGSAPNHPHDGDYDLLGLPDAKLSDARMHPLRPSYLLPDGSLDQAGFQDAKLARRSVTPNQCTFKLLPDNTELMDGGPLEAYYQWVLDGLCYYTITAHASRFTLLPDYAYTNWQVKPADSQTVDRPREMPPHLWKPNMTKYEDCVTGDRCNRKDWASTDSRTPAKSCELVVNNGDLVDQDMINEASVELMQACWILLHTTYMNTAGPHGLKSINIMPIRDVDANKVPSILSAVDKRAVATAPPTLDAGGSDAETIATATAALSNAMQLHDIDSKTSAASATALESKLANSLSPVTVTVTAPAATATIASASSKQHSSQPVTRSPSLTTRTRAEANTSAFPSSSSTPTSSSRPLGERPWYSDDPDSMGSPNYKSRYGPTFNAKGGEGEIRSQSEKDAVRAGTWMWVALGLAMAMSVFVAVCCGCCSG